MITAFIIISVLQSVASVMVGILPLMATIPYMSYVVSGVGYVHSFLDVFWPLVPVWNCFMAWVVLKMILLSWRLVLDRKSVV